jgi:tRNA threonylcarbamoyladenosine biosynthesis protein TsaE
VKSYASRAQLPTGEFTSRSVEETFELGALLGAQLSGGEIILLDGPLGAGKTLFTKGLSSALGLDPDDVTSPSFTLVNHYKTGRLPLYHLDLYRLSRGVGAAHAVDLDELLTEAEAVIVIEWAERMGRYPLPAPVWRVSFAGDGDAPRSIRIAPLASSQAEDGRDG